MSWPLDPPLSSWDSREEGRAQGRQTGAEKRIGGTYLSALIVNDLQRRGWVGREEERVRVKRMGKAARRGGGRRERKKG